MLRGEQLRKLFFMAALIALICAVAAKKFQPSFSFETIDGERHDITSFRARVVFLTFFKEECKILGKMVKVGELPRGFLIDEEGYVVKDYLGMGPNESKDLETRITSMSKRILDRRKSGPSFWIAPEFKVEGGPADLGKTWSKKTTVILQGLGRRLAAGDKEADYFVNGNLLPIDNMLAIEIVVTDSNGAVVTRFSTDISSDDTSGLEFMLKSRLGKLK